MKLLVLLTSLTLARAATTSDNNEHSLLRGAAAGSVDVTSSNQQHQHRSLDPGGADCVPHSSGDGTLVCTIRTQNSVYDANNYNYNRVLQDLCIPAGPAGPLPPPPPPGIGVDFPMPEPSVGIGVDFPMPEPSLGMGSSGTQEQGGGSSCPKMQPLTYGHCSGWIPSGTSEISCQYGNVMCNCAGQDGDAIKIGWSCESVTLGNDGNVITTPIPNPTTPIDTTVDADVFSNSGVEDRLEPEPEPIRSEQVGITLASSPNCPALQPGNGSVCQFYTNSSKCPYQSADFPSGWLTCGCTKDQGWICQEYTLPAFSF